jgi:hypothetical protein
MKKIMITGIVLLLSYSYIFTQDDEADPVIYPPGLSAELSIGFNCDFLLSPLDVSFDYPKGYFGLNIPLKYGVNKSYTASLTEDISDRFKEGEQFEPVASAKQYANATIKVDVPMFKGVATFSNMQMMHINYLNNLTMPRLEYGTGAEGDVGVFLKGKVNVPLDLSIGWETMTFGYAFEVNDMLRFAFNLHRHTFSFDLKGKVDLDIYGNFSVLIEDTPMKGPIDYSLHNEVDGHYEVERWTPTFAVEYWRFGLVSRFGMKTEPKGFLTAKYSVPFFIDPETFTMDEGLLDGFDDPDKLVDYMGEDDNFDNFRNNEINSVEYSTTKNMTWNLPQAHMIEFDIIPDKLSLSYTKLFGSLKMELSDPLSDKEAISDTTKYPDTLDFRFEASVDHFLMLHAAFYNSFINIGIFSLDFAFRDKENLLSEIEALEKLKFGNGIMAPVLNFGAVIGTKIQLLVELDLLPLTALKGGVVYYF